MKLWQINLLLLKFLIVLETACFRIKHKQTQTQFPSILYNVMVYEILLPFDNPSFEKSLANSPIRCTKQLSTLDKMGPKTACGDNGQSSNLGSIIEINFCLPKSQAIYFKIGGDFDGGGIVLIDNKQYANFPYNYYSTNWIDGQKVQAKLEMGKHSLKIVAGSSCCGRDSSIYFSENDGTTYIPLTIDNLKLSCKKLDGVDATSQIIVAPPTSVVSAPLPKSTSSQVDKVDNQFNSVLIVSVDDYLTDIKINGISVNIDDKLKDSWKQKDSIKRIKLALKEGDLLEVEGSNAGAIDNLREQAALLAIVIIKDEYGKQTIIPTSMNWQCGKLKLTKEVQDYESTLLYKSFRKIHSSVLPIWSNSNLDISASCSVIINYENSFGDISVATNYSLLSISLNSKKLDIISETTNGMTVGFASSNTLKSGSNIEVCANITGNEVDRVFIATTIRYSTSGLKVIESSSDESWKCNDTNPQYLGNFSIMMSSKGNSLSTLAMTKVDQSAILLYSNLGGKTLCCTVTINEEKKSSAALVQMQLSSKIKYVSLSVNNGQSFSETNNLIWVIKATLGDKLEVELSTADLNNKPGFGATIALGNQQDNKIIISDSNWQCNDGSAVIVEKAASELKQNLIWSNQPNSKVKCSIIISEDLPSLAYLSIKKKESSIKVTITGKSYTPINTYITAEFTTLNYIFPILPSSIVEVCGNMNKSGISAFSATLNFYNTSKHYIIYSGSNWNCKQISQIDLTSLILEPSIISLDTALADNLTTDLNELCCSYTIPGNNTSMTKGIKLDFKLGIAIAADTFVKLTLNEIELKNDTSFETKVGNLSIFTFTKTFKSLDKISITALKKPDCSNPGLIACINYNDSNSSSVNLFTDENWTCDGQESMGIPKFSEEPLPLDFDNAKWIWKSRPKMIYDRYDELTESVTCTITLK